jgi:hypothetical protein
MGYAMAVPLDPDATPDAADAVPPPLLRPLWGSPGARGPTRVEFPFSAEVVGDGVGLLPDAAALPAVQPIASRAREKTRRPARSFRVGKARVGRFIVGLLGCELDCVVERWTSH